MTQLGAFRFSLSYHSKRKMCRLVMMVLHGSRYDWEVAAGGSFEHQKVMGGAPGSGCRDAVNQCQCWDFGILMTISSYKQREQCDAVRASHCAHDGVLYLFQLIQIHLLAKPCDQPVNSCFI